MFQKQLRYVQIILTLATFAGLLLNNSPLLSAAFVGLILIWHLEMLTGQLRIDTNEYLLIIAFIFLAFFPVLSSNLISFSFTTITYLCLLVFSILFVSYTSISIYKFGHIVFSTTVSFSIVAFIISEKYQVNISYITYLFLSLFFLKTLATFLNVQFSNFQYFFNFFASLIVMVGISSFYDYKFIFVALTAISTSLCVVFVNFLFLRIRYESEYIMELTNEIYLYDYLVAFLFSMYFVDSLNILNGLF